MQMACQATPSLIASFSSGQTVQTRMKCHTRLHPTRVITPAFVRNENVFFSTLVPYIAHKQTMWAQITRCRCGARSGPTLFGKNREADNFFVECASIFIRANSEYQMEYGRFHYDRCFPPPIRVNHGTQVNHCEGCFSVYNRTYIADLYGMRHTAESHTDHRFPPRYKKRLNSTTSLVSYKIEHIVRGARDSRANLMPIYGDLYQIKL